jgi:hypothetical protein
MPGFQVYVDQSYTQVQPQVQSQVQAQDQAQVQVQHQPALLNLDNKILKK